MITRAATSYTQGFKESILQKYYRSDLSLKEFCTKQDLPYTTVYGWKKKYAINSLMSKSNDQNTNTVIAGESLNAQSLKPEEKLKIIASSVTMSEEERGSFLRSKGLLSTDLENWKKEFYSSQQKKKGGRPKLDPEFVQLRDQKKALEKDVKRKDKALAEMSARIVLLKKSHEIWGLPED